MAVYDPSAAPGSVEAAPEPDSETCFMCDEGLTKESSCVVWWGTPQQLNLHPACAKELSLHLAKDGINAANLNANLRLRRGG